MAESTDYRGLVLDAINQLREEIAALGEKQSDALRRMDEESRRVDGELTALKVEIAVLRTKVTLYAGLGSVIGAAAVHLITQLLGTAH